MIELGDENTQLRFDEEGITITTQAEGVPLQFRLDEDGLSLEEGDEP